MYNKCGFFNFSILNGLQQFGFNSNPLLNSFTNCIWPNWSNFSATTTTSTKTKTSTPTSTTTTTTTTNTSSLDTASGNIRIDDSDDDIFKYNSFKTKFGLLEKKLSEGTLTVEDINSLKSEMDRFMAGFYTDAPTVKDEKLEELSGIIKKLDRMNEIITEKDAGKIIENLDKTFNLSDEQVAIVIKATLTTEQKEKIKPLLETALQDLKIKANTYKTSKSYSDLLKLELLCKIEPSTVIETASDKGVKMIKGGIKNVVKGEGDAVTFDVEGSKGSLIDGATWSLKISGDNLTITNVQGKKVKGYNINKDITYSWDANNGCWVNKSGKNTATVIQASQSTLAHGTANKNNKDLGIYYEGAHKLLPNASESDVNTLASIIQLLCESSLDISAQDDKWLKSKGFTQKQLVTKLYNDNYDINTKRLIKYRLKSSSRLETVELA